MKFTPPACCEHLFGVPVCRHGGKEDSGSSNSGSDNATVVEEMLHAVSQHLVRNLSSQSDIQGLEGMALAIRYAIGVHFLLSLALFFLLLFLFVSLCSVFFFFVVVFFSLRHTLSLYRSFETSRKERARQNAPPLENPAGVKKLSRKNNNYLRS